MRLIEAHGMVVDDERPWLGGYFPDGDPSSFCPELWEWALKRFKIKSMIDVGCGSGQALAWFETRGCDVLGVDGLPPAGDARIVDHDYTLGSYTPNRSFDLCWSCEFVEHIEQEFIPNFLATFKAAKIVMMTHGQPWQDGHHHVNCHVSDYWIEKLADAGFSFLARLSIKSRDLVLHQYWGRSGLIFRNRA